MSDHHEVWRDKARGCLLAAACGDGLGAPFEGVARIEPQSLDAWASAHKPLHHTDDTAMTLVLASHLAAAVDWRGVDGLATGHSGYVDQDALMAELVASWQAEPHRGYGGGTRQLFEHVTRGVPWRRARRELFNGGSWGNGAAMRVAPVSLLGLSLPQVARVARRAAEVTHVHPHGWWGAVTQACAVTLAYGSSADTPLHGVEFLEQLTAVVDQDDYRARFDRLYSLVEYPASPAEVASLFGNDSTALAAVPAALAAFLVHPDDPAGAIRHAIAVGGDTDTIATMAGALAGARCGEGALPESWLQRLEAGAELRELAGKLAAAPSDV